MGLPGVLSLVHLGFLGGPELLHLLQDVGGGPALLGQLLDRIGKKKYIPPLANLLTW
jgi:hypothetical protein